ncbi:potassium channel family protein [Pontibacter ramchanderi]|uniref:Ion channel n=1 Tax=Pontibacter ramchanderi TaxID=1179743 RepID=A0A2N3V0M6_9BACT|nr:potassium channel family protein [Pontibacter ramchanderi]PKV75126.1 ion channel [Pontibacter ramchanderi]
MQILFAVAGIVLILAVFRDLVTTTLSFKGGGKLTTFISEKIWRLFQLLSRRNGRSHKLEHVGHLLLIAIILSWVLGMWLGSFLLLLSDPVSVLSSNTDAPADAWEKLYYAGYTLSTMGNGDYKPGSHMWGIVTNMLAFSGLAFITISITYIMPVLSAVILQVKLSVLINCLGDNPLQILINGWNGKNFDRLLKNDAIISELLIQHSENHKAYPIVHYFHSSELKKAIILNLAKLDEAISMLMHVVERETRPDKKDLGMFRGALDFYLEVLQQDQKITTNEMPAAPDWAILEQEGIPLDYSCLEDFHENEQLNKRRRILAHLLEEDGWDWDTVYEKKND